MRTPPPIACGRLELNVDGSYRQLEQWRNKDWYPVRQGGWGIRAFDGHSGILVFEGVWRASKRLANNSTIAWFEVRPGSWLPRKERILVVSGADFHPRPPVTPPLCGKLLGPRVDLPAIKFFEALVSERWSRPSQHLNAAVLPESIRFASQGQYQAAYGALHCDGMFRIQDGVLELLPASANRCGRSSSASAVIASSDLQRFSGDTLSLCASDTTECEDYRVEK